jgi:hypothetical protein
MYKPWAKQEEVFAIHVPGLTFLHAVTAFAYLRKRSRVFIVTPVHDQHERLLEMLREGMSQGHENHHLQ